MHYWQSERTEETNNAQAASAGPTLDNEGMGLLWNMVAAWLMMRDEATGCARFHTQDHSGESA
jgi:hypothetical protein